MCNIDIPAAEDVKNFPLGDKVVIVQNGGKLRVVRRRYYYDKVAKRGKERREYIGYVVDGVYYTTEEYKDQFKSNGKKRSVRKSVLAKTIRQVEENQDAPKSSDEAGKSEASTGDVSPATPWSTLTSKQAAELPVYYEMARRTGLLEDLNFVWGEDVCNAVISLASHWLHSSSNSAYLYESWCEDKLLPLKGPLISKEISQLFAHLANTAGWRRLFFGARVKRLPENELLSFDATEIASRATEISYAHCGKGKNGGYQKQVGLILLVGHDSGMPVLFRMVPGQITDMSTVPDMLFRFDEITGRNRVFSAVLDRGYFSLDNIARFVDSGSRVIIAARLNVNWIREAMEESMSHMWENACRIKGADCWGRTVACTPVFEDGVERKVYVHVFRSDSKSHVETQAFYEDLERFEADWMNWRAPRNQPDCRCPLLESPLLKKYYINPGRPGIDPLVQDDAKIDAATRYFRFFCHVSTMECSPKEALESYWSRDLIEKTFKGGKTDAGADVLRAHQDDTAEGRFIVAFAAMTILNRLRWEMKQKRYEARADGQVRETRPLEEEMTFNEIKNRLSSIRMVFDGKEEAHWMEVTQRQHEIVRRLGCKGLYTSIPDWVKSCKK